MVVGEGLLGLALRVVAAQRCLASLGSNLRVEDSLSFPI